MNDIPLVKLRSWRLACRKGFRQLAQESGVHYSTIYRIESGEIKSPHSATIEALARALEITPFDLFRTPDH
jgi:transcriptional regulator with XRE-family HTH domain